MAEMKYSIYLSGGIEHSPDSLSWRKKMYKSLHRYYNVIIPDEKPCPFDKGEEGYSEWIKKEFIMPDMHDVATSRYVFVLLDQGALKGAGTVSELTMASWMGKEIVVLIEDLENDQIPGWVYGCLSEAVLVNSIEEAVKYYKDKRKKVV